MPRVFPSTDDGGSGGDGTVPPSLFSCCLATFLRLTVAAYTPLSARRSLLPRVVARACVRAISTILRWWRCGSAPAPAHRGAIRRWASGCWGRWRRWRARCCWCRAGIDLARASGRRRGPRRAQDAGCLGRLAAERHAGAECGCRDHDALTRRCCCSGPRAWRRWPARCAHGTGQRWWWAAGAAGGPGAGQQIYRGVAGALPCWRGWWRCRGHGAGCVAGRSMARACAGAGAVRAGAGVERRAWLGELRAPGRAGRRFPPGAGAALSWPSLIAGRTDRLGDAAAVRRCSAWAWCGARAARAMAGAVASGLVLAVTILPAGFCRSTALGDRVQGNWPGVLYPGLALAAALGGGAVAAQCGGAGAGVLRPAYMCRRRRRPFRLPRRARPDADPAGRVGRAGCQDVAARRLAAGAARYVDRRRVWPGLRPGIPAGRARAGRGGALGLVRRCLPRRSGAGVGIAGAQRPAGGVPDASVWPRLRSGSARRRGRAAGIVAETYHALPAWVRARWRGLVRLPRPG